LNRPFLSALAVLAALAAIVAGCGGGDETTDSTTVTLTKTEFIKKGDAICKKGNEQNETEAREFAKDNDFNPEGTSKGQLEQVVEEVLVPSLNKQAEELDALGAPDGDEKQVEAIVVSLEDAAGEIEDKPSLAFAAKTLGEPSRLAADYGFKVCGAV
jgi:hypothetical protein